MREVGGEVIQSDRQIDRHRHIHTHTHTHARTQTDRQTDTHTHQTKKNIPRSVFSNCRSHTVHMGTAASSHSPHSTTTTKTT